MSISKRTFIISLIACIVVSSGISVAGMYFLSQRIPESSGSGTATNYTLTSAKQGLSTDSIVKKSQPSVASITTESVSTDSWAGNYVTKGAGSGVVIQSNGYILTCYHVIKGAKKITVTLSNNKSYTAKVVGSDPANDLSVLKINAKGLKAATYGNSSTTKVGDQVVAIGNPLGQLSNTATTGIVSALNRRLNIDNKTLTLMQTDASVTPGNSGGGLFDASGNLLGIVESKSTGSNVEGLGFAVPINTAAKSAKKIIEKQGDISKDSSATGNSALPDQSNESGGSNGSNDTDDGNDSDRSDRLTPPNRSGGYGSSNGSERSNDSNNSNGSLS